MTKEFIPYEQALALKELGFDEPCFGYYGDNQELIWKSDYTPWVNSERMLIDNKFCSAPTFSQAFDFFREKYGLWQTVLQNTDVDWTYDILPIMGMHDYKLNDIFKTYQEAKLACLNKLIEIVKQK